MSMLPIVPRDFSESRVKQSFKDSTDINKIIKKAQVSGSLAHALKYDAAVYGEFTGVDLLGAYQQIERAKKIFAELPSEVRREFDQDAFKFAEYASDPANIDDLVTKLPALGEPGTQFPKPGDDPIVPRSEEVRAARALLQAAADAEAAGGSASGGDGDSAPSDGSAGVDSGDADASSST